MYQRKRFIDMEVGTVTFVYVFAFINLVCVQSVRACSHEPGTVNYPWVMIAPGQALPRVQMMICWSTSLPRGKFKVIWLLRNCYREWILSTFPYFWCFLELFIGKFFPNINKEHAQDYSCLGSTFSFCSHGEKLPRQGGLPGAGVQWVTRLSKLSRDNDNFM